MGEYILKHIEMTLDESSIERAIREVEKFKKVLKPAMECLIRYLGEKGVEIARAELIFFDDPAYMFGDLSESIKYTNEEDRAVITAGEGLMTEYGSYAMFVEFGTGYEGENSPHHPLHGQVGWEHDVHDHKEHGWWYPAPWGTMEADDGTMLAWTKGMPARPFMYNTLQDLAVESEAAGCKVIAEYIRGERA